MPRPVDFYFWTASTYTYLTVNRISAAAKREGIEVRWKPFNLSVVQRGEVFKRADGGELAHHAASVLGEDADSKSRSSRAVGPFGR